MRLYFLQMACSLCELVGVAIAGIILYSVSNAFQYYVKFIILFAITTIISTLCIPFMLLRPKDYRNALVPAWFLVQAAKLTGTEYEVTGIENVNRETGGIVLINHQSAIDMAVLGTLWPIVGRPTQISKKEVLYSPFGLAAYLWGTIFIDRKNRSAALNVVNKQSIAINERKVRKKSAILLNIKRISFLFFSQKFCFSPKAPEINQVRN
jgi:lysophosphatidate acyltransferase